uniref:Uncharacterized protein n=1 Tax=Candidatus Kentrum sp. SD TaxID=2126332 RepID=A0A451BRP7_9GAMM|nr:MAG: hypothetical protein BECKSD772D_GA0070982_11784 [Candidatus Kentron sp. SD]
MNKSKKLIWLLGVIYLVVLTGCDKLKNEINENWTLSTLEQQIESVGLVTKQLATAKSADALLFLEESDFSELYKQAYGRAEDKMKSLGSEDISNISLKNPELKLIRQGVESAFDFRFTINKYKIPLSGTVKGIVALDANDAVLYLRPALSYVKIGSVDEKSLTRELTKEAAIVFVNEILKHFLEVVNKAFLEEPLEVRLDLQFAKSVAPKKLIRAEGLDVVGSPIDVSVEIKELTPFISEKGIAVLGYKSVIPDIEADENAGDTEAYLNEAFERLVKLFDHAIADLDITFAKLEQSTFLVKKKLVADVINSALATLDVRVRADNFIKIPDDKRHFQKEVRIGSASIPDCSGLRQNCGECRQESCDGPCRMRDCPSCSSRRILEDIWRGRFRTIVDCGERTACEAENAVREVGCAACRTAKATEKALCDAKKAKCKVDNEARIAKCKVKRETLRIVGNMLKVVELKGEFKVPSSHLDILIKKVALTDDLSRVSVTSDLSANANTWLRVWVNPEGVGHIACVFKFRKTLETTASYSEANRTLSAQLGIKHNNDKTLLLEAVTEAEEVEIELSPSPYLRLIQDPGFVLNCSVLNMAVPAFAGVKLLQGDDVPLKAMLGRVKLESKSTEIKIPIQPIKIGDDEISYELIPMWEKNTISFTLQR